MGPYLINDVKLLDSLPGQDAVIPPMDSAYGVQCVGLVKTYSKAGATSGWREGDNVMDSKDVQPGTAIATFNIHHRYASNPSGNHACFFLRFAQEGGFWVLEQHVKPDPDKIQTRLIKARGKDSKLNPPDNADAYSIIL